MKALVAALIGALGCVVLASAARLDTATLAIQGRSNATPSIAAEGQFVVVAWSAAEQGGRTDIYVASSRDAGRMFSAPVRVTDASSVASVSGEQPPRVALVPHAGGDPSIVAVWTSKGSSGTRIMTARSDDGGKSFNRSRVVSGADAVGNRGWESVVTTREGGVGVIWLDHRELAASGTSGSPMNHAAHEHPPEADGAGKAEASKLYFATVDGGAARALTGGVCYCCKTGVAAGTDGSLYAVWRHVYPGNIRDIAFTVSRDGGKTFSPPGRVSEDKWMLDGCPENGPTIAVGGQDAHVIWPTLVSGPPQNSEPTPALFYAVTHDGRAFTPRQRIPTEGVPRHPQLAVGSNGSLWAVWDEAANGTRRAVLARAPAAAARPPRFTRETVDDAASAQYPVVATTGRGAVVAWMSGTSPRAVIRVVRVAD